MLVVPVYPASISQKSQEPVVNGIAALDKNISVLVNSRNMDSMAYPKSQSDSLNLDKDLEMPSVIRYSGFVSYPPPSWLNPFLNSPLTGQTFLASVRFTRGLIFNPSTTEKVCVLGGYHRIRFRSIYFREKLAYIIGRLLLWPCLTNVGTLLEN